MSPRQSMPPLDSSQSAEQKGGAVSRFNFLCSCLFAVETWLCVYSGTTSHSWIRRSCIQTVHRVGKLERSRRSGIIVAYHRIANKWMQFSMSWWEARVEADPVASSLESREGDRAGGKASQCTPWAAFCLKATYNAWR